MRTLKTYILILFCFLFSINAFADEEKNKKIDASLPSQTQAPQSSGKNNTAPPKKEMQVNGVGKAASAKGLTRCAAAINSVTNFLGYNDNSAALLSQNLKNPNERLVSVMLEIPIPNNTALVSADFAPYPPNGCQATYNGVIYWPQKCEVVIKKQFADLRFISKLKQNVFHFQGQGFDFYVMNAGPGCVSLKKETIE
jgi:hypothetical protein